MFGIVPVPGKAGLGLFIIPSEQGILHTKESIVTTEPEPLKYIQTIKHSRLIHRTF